MVLRRQFCLREGARQGLMLQGPAVAVELNETAAEILRRCEGRCSVGGIIGEIKAIYGGTSAEEIERAVQEFLESALRKGWVMRATDDSV